MSTIFMNFSDWIILAFILFITKISNFNPIFCVLVGLTHNFFWTICIASKKPKLKNLLTVLTCFIIKLFMCIYLFTKTSLGKDEIIKGLIYFAIYNIWLYKVHNTKFIDLHNKVFKILTENNPNEDKLDRINRINKQKLDELNNNHINNIGETNKNYKKKLNECGYNFNEIKLDKLNKKNTNKLNKLYSKYYNNLLII